MLHTAIGKTVGVCEDLERIPHLLTVQDETGDVREYFRLNNVYKPSFKLFVGLYELSMRPDVFQ